MVGVFVIIVTVDGTSSFVVHNPCRKSIEEVEVVCIQMNSPNQLSIDVFEFVCYLENTAGSQCNILTWVVPSDYMPLRLF